MKKYALYVVTAATLTLGSCGVMQNLGMVLSVAEAIAGLKDALSKGMFRSFDAIANPNSTDNAVLRFAFPDDAQQIQSTLTAMGLGSVLDQATGKVNNVMRQSVQAARPIFINSIEQMTFRDAMGILVTSNKHAATDYFKNTNRELLMNAFRPVVDSTIRVENAGADWGRIVSVYNALPFRKQSLETNLTDFVAARMIDGMTMIMASEEERIRDNVAARTTEMMRKAFGYADQQLKLQEAGLPSMNTGF